MRYRFVTALLVLCATCSFAADQEPKKDSKPDPKADKAGWRPLFDGKTLKGWKVTEFGAHGTPAVEDGSIVLPIGEPLSGVTREKDDIPKVNYEIALEAQRLEGHDFFLGLTFPVNDSFASLILGGWSGGVCGISSIDGMDASANSTTSFRKFEDNKWYKVRLRVEANRLQAWLDDEQIADADTTDKRISIRVEVSPSKPLGIATYMTKGAYRDIRIRELTPEETGSKPADAGKDPEENRTEKKAR